VQELILAAAIFYPFLRRAHRRQRRTYSHHQTWYSIELLRMSCFLRIESRQGTHLCRVWRQRSGRSASQTKERSSTTM
jgi:hypothetical protein